MSYTPRSKAMIHAIELVKSGMTVPQAAEQTGVIRQQLYGSLKKLGITAPECPRNLTAGNRALGEGVIERIQSLYRAGVARKQIASRFGVSLDCIYKHTRGITVDGPVISDLARGSGQAFYMV